MKALKSIFALLILVVFLFGTTGLSVFHHFCSSSNEHDVTLYPELFDGSGDSCCADEEAGYACARHQGSAQGANPLGFDAPPCCKTVITFHKLEITSQRINRESFTSRLTHAAFAESVTPGFGLADRPVFTPAHFQFYSPPLLSGKQLVLFLNQLRIPFSPSMA
jgi:hypothetical protein